MALSHVLVAVGIYLICTATVIVLDLYNYFQGWGERADAAFDRLEHALP